MVGCEVGSNGWMLVVDVTGGCEGVCDGWICLVDL